MKEHSSTKHLNLEMICTLLCIGLVFLAGCSRKSATNKNSMMLDAYPLEEGGAYLEYEYEYEDASDYLFGENCKYLFYGEVEDSELFRTNIGANVAGEYRNNVYAYALLRVRVMKSICGELKEGQEINLVMPCADQEEPSLQKGTQGMFIPTLQSVEVIWKEQKKKANAIGMVGWINHRFCYEKNLQQGLKELNKLHEVKSFWEENNLYFTGGAAD